MYITQDKNCIDTINKCIELINNKCKNALKYFDTWKNNKDIMDNDEYRVLKNYFRLNENNRYKYGLKNKKIRLLVKKLSKIDAQIKNKIAIIEKYYKFYIYLIYISNIKKKRQVYSFINVSVNTIHEKILKL